MPVSKINLHPEHMRGSGGKLSAFGGKLAAGGQKLESAGQNLVSHASGDRSGIGAVVAKAFGRGVEITGKVFHEGGRVVEGAGQRLGRSADLYEEADGKGAGLLKRVHPGEPVTSHAHGGSSSPKKVSGKGGLRGALSRTKNAASGVKNKLGRALGDPVDMVSGEVIHSQLDLRLAAALPLELERTHLSNYRAGQWFGPSWASTMDQRIEVDAEGVVFASADGMLLAYPIPEDDVVLPTEGPRWPLARDGDGYRVTMAENGHTLRFSAVGDGWPLTSITDRAGNTVEFDHAADGTLTGIRHSGGYRIDIDTEGDRITALRLGEITVMRYGYDEAGRLVEVINSSDRPMRFAYDGDGRLTRWEDRIGCWYEFTYDQAGRCVRGAGIDDFLNSTFAYDDGVTTHTNSFGAATTFRMNPLGQVVSRTDPLGRTTVTEWDRYDRPLSRTDALGRVTRFEYDESGNLTAVTRPDGSQGLAQCNDFGQPVVQVDPDGAVWRRSYDEVGNLLSVTDPGGATVVFSYNDFGHPRTVTDALGHTRRVDTNAAGLPVAVTDPLGATTTFTYDAFGRIAAVTDPTGGVTATTWTIEGKLASRVRPDGAAERWNYDSEGNLVAYTDAVGTIARAEITHFDLRSADISPDGTRLAYAYDTELRLVSVTNEAGLVWRYDYDIAGNLVGETDFNGRTLAYQQDAAEQLVARTNGAGQTVQYDYDMLGNIVSQRAGEAVTTFAYDPVGRMIQAANAVSTLTFDRDPLGRTLAEVCNGRAVVSAYDAAGRRLSRRTPVGADSRWEYDPNDQPLALHTAGQTTTFGYDTAGRELHRQVGAVALAQTWDANHRLHTQAVTRPEARGQALLQRRSYNYRADNSLTSIVDQLAGPRQFTHDNRGRVTAVDDEQYAYDATGNLINGRSYEGTRLRSSDGTQFRYDGQGRVVERLRRTLSGQLRRWTYEWDAEDRLLAVTTPTGDRWHYHYDPLGRRIAKQRLAPDGAVTKQVEFVWDGTQLAEQAHSRVGGPVTTTTWDWEPDGDRPAAQTVRSWAATAPQAAIDQQFYAIVADQVGSPRELFTPDGELAWQASSSLWGQATASEGTRVDCPLRFPGQYHDDETGLDYNYLRYYDPEQGRYLSPDPLGLAPAPNEYAYVDDPLVFIDPLGLAKRKPHFAHVTVYDPHGNVKYHYGLRSGNQLQEESALGFPNASMASHTEARSMRMHGGSPTVPIAGDPLAGRLPVNKGDRVEIHGTKPPCPQCKGAMNRAVSELGIGVSYHWGGNSWQAG
ncbi:RHS repeat-associated core domain-containing protein [Kutzneria sp. NPDC051319]|uniref:RHS repeat-associated core domain-containing protein n=1 Tax=Kutzneria sp. NPDC051319 TaxID=3155047 RepID=UPI0034298B2F